MRHVWSVLCRYSVEDRDSRNFSLIDTLNQVSFKGDIPEDRPVTLPISHRIVSQWRQSKEQCNQEYTVRLRVLTPENVEVVSAEMTVRPASDGNLNTNFHSDTFSYTSDGIYEYEISYSQGDKWIVATQVPLKVTHERLEPEQQEGEPTE